ncbi:MAG: lysophospholipid transporter LplT [Limnohabitans sp.]|jgi:MFS family permease
MPKGFFYLISAQFASGLADNALLILGIAFLSEQGYPGWWAPLLKFSFTLSYVFLAPLLGPLADAVSKSKLMAAMNALKVIGVATFFTGIHPVVSYAIVGMAASAYAPAKYGLITETVPSHRLVNANGWLEVTVVLTVIFGTACGGLLLLARDLHWMLSLNHWVTDQLGLALKTQLVSPLLCLIVIYGIAAFLNFGIPPSHAVYTQKSFHPVSMLQDFIASNLKLWLDPIARISLSVTTLFWGIGAVVQFAVLLWAQQVINIPLEQGTFLQAIVAVGVIAGAAIAGRWINLRFALFALPLGVILGLSLPAIAYSSSLTSAIPLMLLTGAAGGLLMVPMNALLQHRGYELLTAGRSIAVQGFNENASVLLMLGIYSGLLAVAVPLKFIMTVLGGAMAISMLVLTWTIRHEYKSLVRS